MSTRSTFEFSGRVGLQKKGEREGAVKLRHFSASRYTDPLATPYKA